MSDTPYVTRLHPKQTAEIFATRQLRDAARSLRSKVSQGSYNDAELREFWSLIDSAGTTLRESNPQLGERAGLGDKFFSTVSKDKRRPKLPNFLKALIAIEEVAHERLADIDQVIRAPPPEWSTGSRSRLEQDTPQLFILAVSLRNIALQEIARLKEERPNDPAIIAKNLKQTEVLQILASGLQQIAKALNLVVKHPDDSARLDTARSVVRAVGEAVEGWWEDNAKEAVDWAVRIPVLASGIALLGVAGAEMTIATASIAGLVGGEKVIEAIRAAKGEAE